MNFLVILAKNCTDPLYISVDLAYSPLKQVMYILNVFDMFKNTILKI